MGAGDSKDKQMDVTINHPKFVNAKFIGEGK